MHRYGDVVIASTPYPWAVGLLGVMFIAYASFGIRSYMRRYHPRKPRPPQSPQG